MSRVATGAALAVLTLLGWFSFPGHTWLQQDTQIYAPILEHQRDPGVLRQDLLVQHPHVAYTLYDELTNGVRRFTGLSLEHTLAGEQLVFRGLGLLGILLIALSLRLSRVEALLVTAIWSLGATVAGPAVLTVEYEPTPRAFAIPLLLLAMGLLGRGLPVWSGVAAAAAFLLHPPTVWPFWGVVILMLICRREGRLAWAFAPLAAAMAVLALSAARQMGGDEHQQFFGRIGPALESLQRMRAPYNWVSTWWRQWVPQYVVLWLACGWATWRVRERVNVPLRWFVVLLPVLALGSVPLSWLLLEQMKWSLMPQLQPARALLFVTALAQIMLSVAACQAVARRRAWEGGAWFLVVFLLPAMTSLLTWPSLPVALTAAALALASVGALALLRRSRWLGGAAVAGVAVAAIFAFPMVAGVRNYRQLETPELRALAIWARGSTPRDAVFFFPAGEHRSGDPGVFRARALRAVYVDWKGGGQVNYLPVLAEEWWRRWTLASGHAPGVTARSAYAAWGVDYVVARPPNAMAGATPVYANRLYRVYAAR